MMLANLNEQYQVQAPGVFALIGNVRPASAPTLLHARYAVDALSPGLKTALLSDETLMIQVQVQSSFLIRYISTGSSPWSTDWLTEFFHAAFQ